MAVDLVAQVSERAHSGPGALAFEAKCVLALGNADVAHLSPVLSPAVAHNPVLALGRVRAPTDNGHNVVDFLVGVVGDARLIIEDGLSADAASDGAACVNFLGHVVGAVDGTVLRNSGVGVLGKSDALAAGRGKSGASASDVLSGAGEVGVCAESLSALGRAGQVRVRGLVADTRSGLLADRVDPLVRADDGSTVAATHSSAVQDVLHRQVDVNSGGIACNLDAVAKSGHRAVGPARAAVLREVLVAAHGAEVLAVQIAPVVLSGEVLGGNGVLGQRALGAKPVLVEDAGGFLLLAGPHLGHVALGHGSRSEGGEKGDLHVEVVGWCC